jgi:hypothetical protein
VPGTLGTVGRSGSKGSGPAPVRSPTPANRTIGQRGVAEWLAVSDCARSRTRQESRTTAPSANCRTGIAAEGDASSPTGRPCSPWIPVSPGGRRDRCSECGLSDPASSPYAIPRRRRDQCDSCRELREVRQVGRRRALASSPRSSADMATTEPRQRGWLGRKLRLTAATGETDNDGQRGASLAQTRAAPDEGRDEPPSSQLTLSGSSAAYAAACDPESIA